MKALSLKTKYTKESEVDSKWYIIDASNLIVGRMCSRIAMVLQGKNKSTYSPNIDCGDNIIVINSDKVKFSGKKDVQKKYVRYSGYPGSQRFTTPTEFKTKGQSDRIIQKGVKGMLPKNKLAIVMIKKLKIYRDDKHPHEAQKPIILNL